MFILDVNTSITNSNVFLVLEAFSQISREKFQKWSDLYDKKKDLKNIAKVIFFIASTIIKNNINNII